jgi:hypothetical protein
MQWPEMIDVGIQRVRSEPYLTLDQERDILCRNAARFFHLDEALCAG